MPTLIHQLFLAAKDGRLTDPSAEPYSSWPRQRKRALWPSVARGYLYSPHQMVSLERARNYLEAVEPTGRDSRGLTFGLPKEKYPDKAAKVQSLSRHGTGVNC
jgi:hypothetical protein